MTTYADLAEDRDTLNLCLQRLCEDRKILMSEAIGLFDAAANDAKVEYGASASADTVLKAAGASFTLASITADRDSEVRALELSVSVPAPAGAQFDAVGRAKISRQLAARVLADPVVGAERWIAARELGLEGSQDRGLWTQADQTHASVGVDLLATRQQIKHDLMVKAGAARGVRDRPRVLERPKNPYSGTLELMQRHKREMEAKWGGDPAPAPKPAEPTAADPTGGVPRRVIMLSKDTGEMTYDVAFPLTNFDGRPLTAA